MSTWFLDNELSTCCAYIHVAHEMIHESKWIVSALIVEWETPITDIVIHATYNGIMSIE